MKDLWIIIGLCALVMVLMMTAGCQTIPVVQQFDVTYSYSCQGSTITASGTFLTYSINDKGFVGLQANGKRIRVLCDDVRIMMIEEYFIQRIK